MPTIVVEVMPKAELLDPQGKAVTGALSRLGKVAYSEVRIGKRFELTVDGEVTDAILAEVTNLADEIFSNSVIEDVVSITVVDKPVVDKPVVDKTAADVTVADSTSAAL